MHYNGTDSILKEQPAQVGERVKPSASTIDAAPEARAFLHSTRQDEVYRLRYWRDIFWWWRDGSYHEIGAGEVRARLFDFLDQRFSKLTRTAVSNVLEGVRAKATLADRVEPPAWLGDEHWPAEEVLATTNALIHLPRIFGGSDYQREATPRFFNTFALQLTFDPDAPPPKLWLKTLSEWLGDDRQAIDTLQEWAGYLLTPDTRQQKILLLVGPPRSGKGTIARILRHVVGVENAAGPTLASLGTNFGLWPLLGKSLAIVNDARLGRHTDSAAVLERLLTISGEDAVTIDRKLLPPVTCKLAARFMILTNELPRLADCSGALVSRLIVLPMLRSYLGKEDETLTDRLLEELPGILLWAVEGWHRLRQRRRFIQPQSGRRLVEEMEELGSPVLAFARDRCEVGPGCRALLNDLFAAWTDWCAENGRRQPGQKSTFGRDLRAAYPHLRVIRPREGDQRTTGYEGIALSGG